MPAPGLASANHVSEDRAQDQSCDNTALGRFDCPVYGAPLLLEQSTCIYPAPPQNGRSSTARRQADQESTHHADRPLFHVDSDSAIHADLSLRQTVERYCGVACDLGDSQDTEFRASLALL